LELAWNHTFFHHQVISVHQAKTAFYLNLD